ncbi:MAG: efflux RND transporter permease subunit [Candidatus Aureabacteria bacterium]|nr:efflux RND transporter permease subunit [Candidatus Auribacterota bacterium]
MRISDISIKRPVGVMMLTVMVVFLGLFFLRSLSVDLLPDITYPLINVTIGWPGASPEEVEENILKKIEGTLATTEDAVSVISWAQEGSATVSVYFDYGKDMDVALADTRSKLDLVKNTLPDDVEEAQIFKADPSQLPILEMAVYSDERDERELREWSENDLKDRFLGIPGLADVTVSGGKTREIQVVFNQKKLEEYDLSAENLINSLRAENIEYPAGRVSDSFEELTLRLLAKFSDIESIKNIIVSNRAGRIIRVKNIAEVSDTFEEQRVLTRINGKPCVTLSFSKQANANTVTVAARIEKTARMLKEKKIIPDDTDYKVVSSQADYINSSIKNVGNTAFIGGLLAVIVVFLFMHNVKRTLVLATAIPVSILGTFILMGLAGVTLNIFSLGGLVLAIGMLVDNSIVMLENITRHQADTPDIMSAAYVGSGEVAGALVASTLTNLAAIVPFFFIKGLTALLFRDIVVTISVAFIISLLVSLTLVPSLSAHLFRKGAGKSTNRVIERIVSIYRKMLSGVLRIRAIIVITAIGLFIAGLMLAKNLGREFLPQIDDGRVKINVSLPLGSAVEKTDAAVKELEKLIAGMPGVKDVFSRTGGYWQRRIVHEKADTAELEVVLLPGDRRPLSTGEFIKELNKKIKKNPKFKNIQIKVMKNKIRGIHKTSEADVDLRLKGYSLDTMYGIAEDIIGRIQNIEGLENLDISVDITKPELHIVLNREKLSYFNLTAKNVHDAVIVTADGRVATRFTDRQTDTDYDIRVMAAPDIIKNKKAVENIALYPPSGVSLKLREVADVIFAKGPVRIDRENQVRLMEVTGDVIGRNAGIVTDEIKEKLRDLNMPEGYTLEYGGEEESAKESSRQLLIVIALAVFLVFTVMAVQYESLVDPVIIMVTLPLAVTGSVFLLYLTGTPIGATVFLGLILLAGIVVNNAIVLVQYINDVRAGKKLSMSESVITAAAVRLRPILMTTFTTVAGLLPLALLKGEGLEMLKPLAVTIVGGLSVSAFLTLFVIPSVYMIFHGGKHDTG